MTMALDEFAVRALSVPFLEKGRGFDGWDCYGLVYVAYQELYGIELPDASNEYKATHRRAENQALLERHKAIAWMRLEGENYEPGDVALVQAMGRDCHVGLMLPNMWMLHVQDDVGGLRERLDRPPWRDVKYNKLEGFYRHAQRRTT